MSKQEESAKKRAAADAVGQSFPTDISANAIDPNVVSALGRWRDVDPHSLHKLASVLWTKGGIQISDSPAYLRSLHGFVAEKVVYEDLSSTHDIVWPEQTNVPAYDMIIDGTPTQIKEGTTAYQQVLHASVRYPHVTSFVTDQQTAERLQAHGFDALGVGGLEPSEIASNTNETALGLQALEHTGQLHVPLLTSVFSICRYWERYDAEKIDAASALKFAATDIAAQSAGAAAGLKLAAIYVVATGGFGIAALPLTAAAMVGALGLRHIVNKSRGHRLQTAIEYLDVAKNATETALEIIVAKSRDFASSRIESAYSKCRELNNAANETWVRQKLKVLEEICVQAARAHQQLTGSISNRAASSSRLAEAFRESDLGRRLVLIRIIFRDMRTSSQISTVDKHAIEQWMLYTDGELARLRALRETTEKNVSVEILAIERAAKLDIASEYALLVYRLARASETFAKASAAAELEAERIGAKV